MVPDEQGAICLSSPRKPPAQAVAIDGPRGSRHPRPAWSISGFPKRSCRPRNTLNYVENADFAGLAMAVEDHRSLLRKVPMKPPMLYFYITSNYGWRKHPVLKKRMFHHGIDLAGTWQETVQAPAPGTVIFAGREGAFGKVVKVRHANDIITIYAHLAKITVRKARMSSPVPSSARWDAPAGWTGRIFITRSATRANPLTRSCSSISGTASASAAN